MLTKILRETSLENNRRLIGKKMDVLVETRNKKLETRRELIGKTEHFKNVRFGGDGRLVGEFARVKITSASDLGLEGKIIH